MSDLRKLTLSQFNAAVARGVKQRESQIPSNLRTLARKFIAGASQPSPSNSAAIRQVDADKKKKMQELVAYQKRMDKKRQSLISLGNNPSREAYLDAGLPLINKDAVKDFVPR